MREEKELQIQVESIGLLEWIFMRYNHKEPISSTRQSSTKNSGSNIKNRNSHKKENEETSHKSTMND